MTTSDSLAEHYHAGRLGYSNDLYNALAGYGLAPGMKILDIGCGTGLASLPLIENGFSVVGIDPSEAMLAIAKRELPSATWTQGVAEELPFQDGTVDAAISAQAFHRVDRRAAIREILRVLRPGGIVAVWWKMLVTGDAIRHLRDSVAKDLGVTMPGSGMGGFKEFYGHDWSDTSLRVIPWRTATSLSKYLEYERSRSIVREIFGDRTSSYLSALESRLCETFGSNDPLIQLTYSQYLYLAKK